MPANMLSLPAYTEEMSQQGQTSITPGQSLFSPQGPLGSDQISTGVPDYQFGPGKGYGIRPDGTPMTSQELFEYNKSMGLNPFANEPGRDASGQIISGYGQTNNQMATTPIMGMNMMATPAPSQQLNTPSFEQLAQTNSFQPPLSGPMATQPPSTQAAVQQIQAPVTNIPTTPVPVPQAPPATQQLLQQIAAPTTPRTPPPMNQATQQFAQQFRPQPMARPQPIARPQPRPVMAPRPQPRPVMAPRPQPRPVMAQRPMAKSVSRVNPPLLPSRPMARR